MAGTKSLIGYVVDAATMEDAALRRSKNAIGEVTPITLASGEQLALRVLTFPSRVVADDEPGSCCPWKGGAR